MKGTEAGESGGEGRGKGSELRTVRCFGWSGNFRGNGGGGRVKGWSG